MARGGYRPGAGRKSGTPNKKDSERRAEAAMADADTLAPLPENPMLPLEYMLRVLNDPNVDPARKDRIASLAAPFCHARFEKGGKKDARDEAAKNASKGKFGVRQPPANMMLLRKEG